MHRLSCQVTGLRDFTVSILDFVSWNLQPTDANSTSSSGVSSTPKVGRQVGATVSVKVKLGGKDFGRGGMYEAVLLY